MNFEKSFSHFKITRPHLISGEELSDGEILKKVLKLNDHYEIIHPHLRSIGSF